ncbi:hypothetical protein B841_08535 [Corynebacterium maris DSM 45190]|uniref:YbjN domain-containing protein n=1 Tax=Corynebacterium maris DSM 45190 TaxID=1224163 RepID=S5T3F8_9CORY|nr:YbjN domain-containing protein [Corynebacterium maris]AGS35180.1 hypothetical protein B841_08535 [Corynebacterium maris DSM 45190]
MGRRSAPSPGPGPVRPVTVRRAKEAADSFGFQSLADEDRLLFPWLDHLMTVTVEGGGAAQATLRPEALVCRTRLRRRLDFSAVDRVVDVLNEWNAQSLSPTMSMALGGDLDDGGVDLHLCSMSLTGPGLSDEQLATVMSVAVETSVLAVSHLLEHFPELSTPDTDEAEQDRRRQDSAAFLEGGDWDAAAESLFPSPAESRIEHPSGKNFIGLPEPAPSLEPEPVTLPRIDGILADLDIPNTATTDEVVIAWINSVLFGFFVDNGPSYLVKAHWNPNLDPASRMRVALVCNDFNVAAGKAGAKAYAHLGDDGVQVRVEYTVPAGDGLTDAQLDHMTAVAVSQLLYAVHTVSAAVTGTSAVGWPGP